jgi:hypothetical protein
MRGAPLPAVLDGALGQLTVVVEQRIAMQLRLDAALLVDQAEAAGKTELLKADPPIELRAKLNALVLGNGKGLIDVAGNLVTSRLVSYGFLSQAILSDLETYQIEEVLDRRICPVCLAMHGRIFDAAREHAKLEGILQLQDPEALKHAAPRPKQDPGSVKTLKGSATRRCRPLAGARRRTIRCAAASCCRSAPRHRCRRRRPSPSCSHRRCPSPNCCPSPKRSRRKTQPLCARPAPASAAVAARFLWRDVGVIDTAPAKPKSKQ